MDSFAYTNGLEAGRSGLPAENPYHSSTLCGHEWEAGYERGLAESGINDEGE